MPSNRRRFGGFRELSTIGKVDIKEGITIKVTLLEVNAHTDPIRIDVRQWGDRNGYTGHTNKGFTITQDAAFKLHDILSKAVIASGTANKERQ